MFGFFPGLWKGEIVNRLDLKWMVVGYAPHESVLDPDEYRDYRVGRVLTTTEVQLDLDNGNFPPGVVIVPEGVKVGRVTGLAGRSQVVEAVEVVR